MRSLIYASSYVTLYASLPFLCKIFITSGIFSYPLLPSSFPLKISYLRFLSPTLLSSCPPFLLSRLLPVHFPLRRICNSVLNTIFVCACSDFPLVFLRSSASPRPPSATPSHSSDFPDFYRLLLLSPFLTFLSLFVLACTSCEIM